MAKHSIIFNHVDLSSYMIITDIQRDIGNPYSLETSNALRLGVGYQNRRIGPKTIKVQFALVGNNIEQTKHVLAGIFNVPEPVEIKFTDEPDKYYLGMLQGDTAIKNVRHFLQKGELDFFIPDGVAHSTAYKRVVDYREEGSKLIFHCDNEGNTEAFPVITVKNNAENGYLGFVNQNSVCEVGSREETDGKVVNKSETLFDYRDGKILDGFKAALINQGSTNDPNVEAQVGTVGTVNYWDRPHLYLADKGTLSRPHRVGSLTWEIPADSEGEGGSLHEYIWWRQIFWAGSVQQYGFMKLSVLDENKQFLYGVETFKRSIGVDSEYNFLAADGYGGYQIIKSWGFKATHQDAENPFNAPRGWSDLKRLDDKVIVYWFGSYPEFSVPKIRGKKSRYVTVTFGSMGHYPMITHNYLDGIFYQKMNVSKWEDVPNRFPIGSKVIINSENDTLTVDGLPRLSDMVQGADFLSIPPGQSDIEVLWSPFCQVKPTITISFEERWL